METIEISNVTKEALQKIKNDTINELLYDPTFDDVIRGLIIMVLNEGLGKEFKTSMELIKYDKKNK